MGAVRVVCLTILIASFCGELCNAIVTIAEVRGNSINNDDTNENTVDQEVLPVKQVKTYNNVPDINPSHGGNKIQNVVIGELPGDKGRLKILYRVPRQVYGSNYPISSTSPPNSLYPSLYPSQNHHSYSTGQDASQNNIYSNNSFRPDYLVNSFGYKPSNYTSAYPNNYPTYNSLNNQHQSGYRPVTNQYSTYPSQTHNNSSKNRYPINNNYNNFTPNNTNLFAYTTQRSPYNNNYNGQHQNNKNYTGQYPYNDNYEYNGQQPNFNNYTGQYPNYNNYNGHHANNNNYSGQYPNNNNLHVRYPTQNSYNTMNQNYSSSSIGQPNQPSHYPNVYNNTSWGQLLPTYGPYNNNNTYHAKYHIYNPNYTSSTPRYPTSASNGQYPNYNNLQSNYPSYSATSNSQYYHRLGGYPVNYNQNYTHYSSPTKK